jgi:formylmethanofuran dehydrogenase subunit E-like metal-binding protein
VAKTIKDAADELENVLDMDAQIKRLSNVTVKLSKPVEWEGKTYEELTMDYEGMTGKDMEAIDDELSAVGIIVANPNINHRYHRILAARAAKVPSDMLRELPLRDYQKVTATARSFLLATA